jgi:hypothetical protein
VLLVQRGGNVTCGSVREWSLQLFFAFQRAVIIIVVEFQRVVFVIAENQFSLKNALTENSLYFTKLQRNRLNFG